MKTSIPQGNGVDSSTMVVIGFGVERNKTKASSLKLKVRVFVMTVSPLVLLQNTKQYRKTSSGGKSRNFDVIRAENFTDLLVGGSSPKKLSICCL